MPSCALWVEVCGRNCVGGGVCNDEMWYFIYSVSNMEKHNTHNQQYNCTLLVIGGVQQCLVGDVDLIPVCDNSSDVMIVVM